MGINHKARSWRKNGITNKEEDTVLAMKIEVRVHMKKIMLKEILLDALNCFSKAVCQIIYYRLG